MMLGSCGKGKDRAVHGNLRSIAEGEVKGDRAFGGGTPEGQGREWGRHPGRRHPQCGVQPEQKHLGERQLWIWETGGPKH